MLRTTLFLCFIAIGFAWAEDPFALGVRNTPHLPPAEEQKLFKLPPGFEIQLVAAEPQIQKPLNMSFDGQGRLWVTDTVEYPYAAPLDKPGRDTIKVIEFDYTTGKATKISTFVDGLNIPIGLLPYKDGVIAYSIPNIWFFRDTDGDGKCDLREVLYGPFDHTRDTHGMCNAFRLGFDGWIYACHGFNNDSRVKGKDGHEVHMQSGNTFRFKPDGSRIEHFTHGQVNPFGMCFDDLFNIFTADCHSKPITQLLRGAYYPSFGKPHDGLGFVPSMMEHSHGSTAICGIVWVNGENFPPEYRGHLLSGNVMTSRINHNSLVAHGSTYQCKEEPDFLSAGDPWFRPVDLQIGPDGALYIADFYNRIIGHYEVPLPHPGRDRTSGRIWRVVYKGDAQGTKSAVKQRDLTKASDDELIAELNHPVLGQRLLAQREIVQRELKARTDHPERYDGALFHKMNEAQLIGKSSRQKTHAMWVMHNLRKDWLCRSEVKEALAKALIDSSDDRRVHAMKMVAERPDLALKLNIADEDANVVRAAAEALAARVELPWKLKKSKPLPVVVDNPPADWTSQERLYMLLATLEKSNEKDFLLRQAIRIAVRDLCEHNESFALPWNDLAPLAKQDLAQILLSVKSTSVAHNLRQYLNDTPAWNEQVAPILTHIARYANPNDVASIVADVRDQSKTKTTNLLPIILAVHQGLAQRGVQSPELQVWAEEVCGRVLAEHKNVELPWQNIPLPNAKDTENPWTLQVRPSADGNKEALFYSSLVKGEQKTGMNRSQPFELPRELSFWCAGHIGFPGKQTLDLNYIRLRDANNHELLAEARPPRNDMAQKIVWNLEKQAGKRGYVELIDGDAGNAYAWLAVGRFSVSELNPNDQLQQLQRVTQLIKELQLKSLLPQLTKLLVAPGTDPALRGNIATTLHAFQPDARYAAVARLIPEPNLSVELSTQLATAMTKREDDKLPRLFEVAVKNVPHRIHTQIAEILASDVAGGTLLLQLVEQGKLSPYLLRHSVVSQKMQAHAQPSWSAKIKLLTERLPAVNAELEKLLNARRQSFATAKADIATGSKIFEKHCAVCHQIGGKGAVIGPQLDGIGGRGLERILEDVLDPHRNVDVAFRTTSLTLHDGRIITGLVRREEGEQLVLVGNDGKEFRLNRTDVEERQLLTLSLMPSFVQADEKGSFVESMETNDMHHLLAFLLSQTAKHAP